MKTSELTGQQLDQAVVECEGHVEKSTCWLAMPVLYAVWNGNYKPSSNWSQGGPIIEREKINVQSNGDHWIAFDCDWLIDGTGPTPLIAAMRCYVASKLGDEVDKPDQLTERETKNG